MVAADLPLKIIQCISSFRFTWPNFCNLAVFIPLLINSFLSLLLNITFTRPSFTNSNSHLPHHALFSRLTSCSIILNSLCFTEPLYFSLIRNTLFKFISLQSYQCYCINVINCIDGNIWRHAWTWLIRIYKHLKKYTIHNGITLPAFTLVYSSLNAFISILEPEGIVGIEPVIWVFTLI